MPKRIYIYKVLLLVVSIAIFTGLTSCENMRDDNGDLGGMWQMTEWRNNATNEVSEVPAAEVVYYSFECDLMRINKSNINKGFYLATFKQSPDKIILTGLYKSYPTDKAIPMDDPSLALYAIPEDGIYDIVELTNKKMVLRTKNNTLSFRKY